MQSKREAQELVYRRQRQRRKRKRHQYLWRTLTVLLLAAAIFGAGFLFGRNSALRPSPAEPSAPATGAPTPSPSPKPSSSQKPVTADDWKLQLVNQWNPIDQNYTIETVTLTNGLQVDERCYPDLQDMMDACRAAGLEPVICSGYRTWEVQETLYENKVSQLMAQGYTRKDAEEEGGTVVAVPGTSEHQLGLAVDIADMNHQLLDESQEDTKVQKWLMEHSWEYGFILRYPTGKSDLTGIIYEPWHYRYVGKEDAKEIHDLDLCLEEYLAR